MSERNSDKRLIFSFFIFNFVSNRNIIMKISEYTQTESLNDQVKALKVERDNKPNLEELKKQWKVSEHKTITDTNYLPNKEIKDENSNFVKYKYVNRLAVPFQKLIVNSAVTFGFGNEVELIAEFKENSDEERVFNIVKKILDENKSAVHNRKAAKECYRASEVAELWYYEKTDEPHEDYGFPCEFRVKVKLLTPWNGDKLYPHFDHYDKMQVFARGYFAKQNGKDTEFLDIFTNTEYKQLQKTDNDWQEVQNLDFSNTINKIPIIYATQEGAEWEDVQYDIDRLELLMSRHAEINDYHASPKTFIQGELTSVPQAGESNSIIQGEVGSSASILSWNDSPESMKLEINTRLSNIFKFTKTPDISFESIKGLNQVSGVMLKMLFMDAHIKVLEKEEIWDDYYERRFNLLKTYVGNLLFPELKQASKRLKIKPKFNPYMIDDQKDWINTLMTANGNKPLISQEKSAELSRLTSDRDWDTLKKEMEADNHSDVFTETEV